MQWFQTCLEIPDMHSGLLQQPGFFIPDLIPLSFWLKWELWNKEIYEAASIDGATPWQADRYITLPLMRNVCGTCVTLASVAMVSQFDIIYMTTKGGPGTSTLNLPIYLYKAATLENNYGKANAVGVVQIIIGITLVILIKGLFREKKEAA